MKTGKMTRWIGLWLSVLMLVTLLGAFTMTASAADGDVSYVERSWNGTQVVDTQKTLSAGGYTSVTAGSTAWGIADTVTWYVVDSTVTLTERITVTGDVHLVLVDGAVLTANLGVNIPEGSSLTVYGQSVDTGKLLAAVATDGDERWNAAIGGNYNEAFGTLTVHGGTVEGSLSIVTNKNYSGAGIGGAYNGGGGSITVYGGTVKGTVNYDFSGAGIGSGKNGGACTITVYGGYVEGNANHEDGANAGIGGGEDGAQGDIFIHGGTVVGTSQQYAAGIGCASEGTGGTITITGGTVTGTAGYLGAGIGGGRKANPTLIHISGGTVTGTSVLGAGVGFGYENTGGTLLITGGTVNGTSSGYWATGSGAGVGAGSDATGCILTITGGTVTGSNTASQRKGADIGGGYRADVEVLTVYGDATLTGTVDKYAAGLVQSGDTVTVTGNYTLPFDLTIDEGTTLVISEGATLTVPEGKTLTNNGAVTVEGSVVNNGTATCGSTGTHGYREACIVNCALCGEARADAADHTYDTGCDTTCNVCGDVRVDVTEHAYSEIGVCDCGVFEPAVWVTNENYASLGLTDAYVDYYAVGNYGQFLWIRDHINSGHSATNFVLTADIDFSPLTNDDLWVPITDFGGTFDGGFHRIKNLYLNYVGGHGVKSTLFWRSQTSTYRNVIIDSSCYFKGVTAPLVSIITEDSGGESYDPPITLTFENCGNEANVDSGSYCAGLALINSVDVSGSFTNCYNAGNVSGTSSHGAYGITSGNYLKFYNCYNSGTITAGTNNAYAFSGGNASYQNNCHDYKANPDGFASGEVAYLLSQGVTVNEVFYSGAIWGQDLTTGEGDTHTDAAPVLGGARVYSCNGYSNVNEHVFNQYGYDDNTHWIECTCGEKSGAAAVAHDHSLAKYDDHNHWTECECGHQTGVTSHVTGDWDYDEEQHWKRCSGGCEIATLELGTHAHSEDWTVDTTTAYHLCECGHQADIRALSYSVTFDKNGGTGDLENTTFAYSAETKFEYTVPACELTYVNHTFTGWLVSVGGNELGIKQANEKLDVDGDVVLTAQWKIDFMFETDPAAKSGLVYNGEILVLITEGTGNSAAQERGTVKYRLGDGEWSEVLPAAIDAGVYTVHYGIFEGEDGPYADGFLTVTVDAKPITPAIENLTELDYVPGLGEENPSKPSIMLSADGETIDPVNYTVSYANNTANGTATVTVTANADGNYSFEPVSKDYQVTDHQHQWEYSVDETDGNVGYATCISADGGTCVEGRVVTLTLTAPTNLTYDGLAKEATLEIDLPFERSFVIVYTDPSGSVVDTPTDAGNYRALVSFGSYLDLYVEFEILPLSLTLEWSHTALTYNGSEQKPAVSILTGLPITAESVVVTVNGAEKDAGNYTATATVDSENFTLTNATQEFSIAPKPLTLEWSNLSFVYDNEEHFPTAAIADGVIMGDTVNVAVSPDHEGSAIAADNYRVIAKVDNSNYTLTNATQAYTIVPLELESPVIEAVEYNGELQIASLPLSDDYIATVNNGGVEVGEYDVVLTLTNFGNTKWKDSDTDTLTLKFTIKKRVLDPSGDTEFQTVYTGEEQAPRILTGAPFKCVVVETFTNVGEYEVVLQLVDTVRYEWKNPDSEDATLTTAIFTIGKAPNEWVETPNIEDWHMGEEPSEPVYQALFGNGNVQVVYFPANGSSADATEEIPTQPGEYVALFTISGTENYTALIGIAEFQILDPHVMIGSWALPVFHYMDTNGIISEARPEGGYAYLREDGVLVLNHFELDASVLATVERTEENEHLYARDFDLAEAGNLLIKLNADTEVLLIGENRLENFGSEVTIGSVEFSLTLRGGTFIANGGIVANGLALENCTVIATGMASYSFLRASSCLFELGSNIIALGDLTLTDCTVSSAAISAQKNITVEGSVVRGERLMIVPAGDVFYEMTVRNSRIGLMGRIGLDAASLVAENSVFEITASESGAIRAEILDMENCELKLSAVFGVSFRYAELTDCTVEALCENGLFNQATDDTSSTLVLNNCEIEAETEGAFPTMIRATEVVVNGGKLKLTGGDLSLVILCDAFSATDAELDLNYGEMALKAYEIEIRRTKLTVEQAETATAFGTAIESLAVVLYDSTVSIQGGMKGIYAADGLILINSKLDIELAVNEGATASPVTEGEATEDTETVTPVYVGIETVYFSFYGADSALTVTLPEDAQGKAILVQDLYYEENTMQITAPEGAEWKEIPAEEEGAPILSEIVVIDGETVTYPNTVMISYVESEEDSEEDPTEPALYIGDVLLVNGNYLDNNGEVSNVRPEGGYAHLLDGVLTLHDFAYYGVGYLFFSEYDEEFDTTYELYAGIYSTDALTLRLEGKNLLDLSTFAGDRETYGIVIDKDLTVEGDGVLKVFATDDGIEVWGALTVSDCTVEMETGSEGFDVYGTALFENCKLVLNVVDDGIWAQDDLTVVDCTVEIVSDDDDGLYADADVTLIDSTFRITASSDGIDAEDDLIMIGCEAVIEAGDTGIEVDNDVEITDCVLQITADDHGIGSEDESIVITDSTLVIDTEENGIYVENGDLSLIGSTLTVTADDNAIRVSAKLTVEDSALTLTASEIGISNDDSNAMLLSMSGANNLFEREIIIRNSTVAVNDSYIGIVGFRMTAMDSTLHVNSYIVAVDAGILLLENCEGTLNSNEYVSIVAGDLKVIGGDLKLSGSGVIEAEMVRLSDSKLGLYKWGDLIRPVIVCGVLSIEGENTEIFCNMGDYFAVYEDINVDSNLIFCDPYENLEYYFDPSSGRVFQSMDGYPVGEFLILPRMDDATVEEEKVLVIGDKELGIGEYLDSEGNVTSEIPAGGFAYFNGSELILKNFTLEGGGTTLITLNGEEITAGIYNPGALTVRLIGSNSLKFTSAATVGIALGDGDLTLLGDGSLTLDTTATGIALYGDLTVEKATLTVHAIDLGVKANGISLTDASVAVNAAGEEAVTGVSTFSNLEMRESNLTVSVENTGDVSGDAIAVYCEIGNVCLIDSSVTLNGTGANGLHLNMGNLTLTDSILTVKEAGDGIILPVGTLTVNNSALTVSVNSAKTNDDILIAICASELTLKGSNTRVSVTVDGNGTPILASDVTLSDGLTLLIPEGGKLEQSDSYYRVVDANGADVKQVTVGIAEASALEAMTVTVGGVELANGEYLDTLGNITTEKPEGGYAYLKDGVLTLNNFVYLTKKYDSYEGIYTTADLTLVLIGENKIDSYNKTGIRVEGYLTVNGSGTLTVTSGEACVKADGVIFLGGELRLTSTKGKHAMVASDVILLGERTVVSVPVNAILQKLDGEHVFTDARGNAAAVLTLTWAAHSCIDEDPMDHLCDICGKDSPTCRDADRDHACDACGGEMGYHADTDRDHVCEYGCGVAIGVCEDNDLDHECDYGCDKVFGECKDADTDHACDYGCDKVYGNCADADRDHACDYGCDKVFGECKDADTDHACDYGCDEVFGECKDADTDHACDYGCDKVYGNCTDADRDHACDYGCDKVFGECKDADTDHICDYGCDKVFGECKDANTDHACDYGCDKVYGNCADADRDHACDYGCDKVFGECKDADTDHACDYGCDEVFGTHAAASGSHICAYCKETVNDCGDTDANHVCDICGVELQHQYSDSWESNADRHWHECSCGDIQGEADHFFGEWTVTKEATVDEAGSKSRSCACGFTEEEVIPMLSEDGADRRLPAGAIVAIVLGSTALVGVGGFAIWWFAISKRTLAQLGAGCKGIAMRVGGACKGAAQKVKGVFTKK